MMANTNNQPFNPDEFGLKYVNVNGGSGRSAIADSYMRMSVNAFGDISGMELLLSKNDAQVVQDMFGEYVDAAYDDKGNIYLFKPIGSSSGRKLNKANKFGARDVFLKPIAVQYQGIMGKFRRLYMSASVYAGGRAVKMTPTGKRE